MAIPRVITRTSPECREVGTALQASQDQKSHGPESYDNDGYQSNSVENSLAAQNTEDAAEEEQSANFYTAQSAYREEVKSNI